MTKNDELTALMRGLLVASLDEDLLSGQVDPMFFLTARKEIERESAAAAVRDVRGRHIRKNTATEPLRVWYAHNPVHNRDLPSYAEKTVLTDCWTPEAARQLVQAAWTMPEWPGQIGRGPWLRMWRKVGFCCDVDDTGGDTHDDAGEHCVEHEPDATITLWRAALPQYRRGLSWTTDRDQAEWFARRGVVSQSVLPLWRVSAPRERVLAHLTRRGESEFVTDVTGLTITADPIG